VTTADPGDAPAGPRRSAGATGEARGRRLRVRGVLFGSGLLSYLLFQLLSRSPGWVETWYAGGLGPVLTDAVARVTGVVPLPLAELVIAAFLARQLHGLWRGVRAFRAGERGPAGLLLDGSSRVAGDVGAALFLFYLVWGFHYARPPLEQRMGLGEGTEADSAELVALSREAMESVNRAYRDLHGSEDAGHPTRMPADREELMRRLRSGWERTARELELPGPTRARYGPVKPFWPSEALAYLGIGGFYFPWTGEPVFNSLLPAPSAVHTMVHEMAHQRGYAPEDDANFLAFLVASRSPDPLARYAAWFHAHVRLQNALGRVDREAWKAIRETRIAGVRRDIEAVVEYNRRYRGWMSRASREVNDAYLRSQRVEGGVASYGMVTRLLVAYARTRDGRLTPAGSPIPPPPGSR
jgi:hypothetical protein